MPLQLVQCFEGEDYGYPLPGELYEIFALPGVLYENLALITEHCMPVYGAITMMTV